MADQRILYSERMVGAGHPTLPDTLNRITLIEHNIDGTHKVESIAVVTDSVNGLMSSTDKTKLDGIDLAGVGVGQPFIKFDLGATGAPATEGTVNWNNTENCLEFKTGMGNIVQIGKELGDSGINKTGGTVTDGKVVYASGAQGKKFEFMYADAREASKCAFVGIVTHNTENNTEGPVTSYGTVNNLNTSSWSEGTKLYIAANATGDLTNVAPSSPNFRVWVATVTYSHVSDGSIFVDPKLDYTNGITLTSVDVITSANLPTSTTIGSVSASEIGYLGGVTSSIQAQFNGKENISTKGQALGYCPLDASAKVAEAYLPDSVLGQVDYQGTWNATTNTPAIPAASSANRRWYYIVSVSGTTLIDGISEWTIGDWIISNGTTWNKVDNTDSVSSVFGRAGAIIANSGDYTASQITNVPVGNISATTVQAAINELDTEKASTADSRFVTNGDSHDHVGGDGAQIAYSSLSGTPDPSDYAPAAKGVTNGDSHDHSGGDGGQIAYSSLSGAPTSFEPSDGDKGDITVSGSGATWTVDSVASNLTFLGTAARIRGDFSHATVANRTMFQTSTTDGTTAIEAIPNGTATTASFIAVNAADPTNASVLNCSATATDTRINSGYHGTGSHLPMTFYTGGSQRLNLATDGTFTSVSGALGYGTGAGGTVTQATSKSTAVTLNKPCGQITMNNAALGAGAEVVFVFNNNLLSASDQVYSAWVGPYAGVRNYQITVGPVGSGLCYVWVKNISAGSLSEAVVINFQVHKGATS